MTFNFLIGLIGSLVLVTGAAWPESIQNIHPARSTKNRLFAVGNACMCLYAVFGYLQGGSIFFIFLQILIAVATVLMMTNVSDKIGTPIIVAAGAGLVVWALSLFEGYTTLILICGLVLLALGYVLDMATVRRSLALTIGSMCVAFFSYLVADWIFFWLNLFFALFSGYYVVRGLQRKSLKK